jgi:DNA topoisomerase-2
LKHVIDGGMPSRRKIWAGARKRLSHNNQRIKVYQLGGDIAKSMNYHHGDSSLYGGITGEAQCFPGAREFPLLLPLSNFGSRKKGGLDAGSPRYIYTKLNKALSDALFPPQDDYILDYTFDDGQRGEPVFYVPTVPLAILENYTSPGHGWVCMTWARDYWEVSKRIRERINSNITKWDQDLPFTQNRFKHRIEIIRGVENSIGTYKIDNNTLTITELPVRIWNEHFLNGNPDKKDSTGIADMDDIVDTPIDKSTDTDIHIELTFKSGFLQNLPSGDIDPIIKLLDLKQSLKPQLNFIGLNGTVQEFERYDQIFDIWFNVRAQYYTKRIERLTILLKLKIVLLTQQLEFISKREILGLSNKRIREQNEILERSKFIKINKTLLDKPNYTNIEKLEHEILHGPGASHDYLRKMDADDLSDEGRAALEEKLEDAETELKEMTSEGAAQKIQLKELDKLDSVVKKGQTEGWLAWECKAVWDN